MPRAYLRGSLLLVSAAGERGPGHVAPDARAAVDALRSCGWDVVILGARRPAGADDLGVRWGNQPETRDRGAWLLTDDVADNRWARPLGLRTALVGHHADLQSGPARCDLAFRDLRTAALEIIAGQEVTPLMPAGHGMDVEAQPTLADTSA